LGVTNLKKVLVCVPKNSISNFNVFRIINDINELIDFAELINLKHSTHKTETLHHYQQNFGAISE